MSDASLEARLNRIERSLSRWKRLALACVALVLCVPFLGQARPAKVLVVDHFTVRDHDGKPRLVISRGGKISFRDKDGLEVGTLSEEGVQFTSLEEDGRPRRISLLAPVGKNPPSFSLEGGERGMWFEVGPRGPAVSLYRHTGEKRDPKTRALPMQTTHYRLDTIDVVQGRDLLGRLDLREH